MMWFFAILVVLVMGGVAALAAGRGAPMAEAYDDRPDALVPRDGPLRAEHVRRVRFSLAFRGYRMSEVDTLLDRVARQLELAEGTPLLPDAGTPPAPAGSEDAAGQAEAVDTPDVREVRGDQPPR
jgi:DivIVA domain-containing protein